MDFAQGEPHVEPTEMREPMARLLINGGMILSLLLAAGSVLAQGAPLDLTHRPAPVTPAPATSPPAAKAPAGQAQPAPPPETPQMLIERINRSLNGMATLIGDFSQINADGRRRTGKLYVMRPGKLRFDYDPPSQLEVVSDGSQVAVIDKRVPQQDLYGIGQTPLKFLVADKIDITRDTKVLSVARDKDEVILEIEDKNTIAGTSRIRIHFDGESFQIRRWTVTDPQGIPTTIQLANLNTQQRPSRSLFTINYQFNAGRQN
jgi:outer membrane lipoprotein-sorting protein